MLHIVLQLMAIRCCWAQLAWRSWLPLPDCTGRACDGVGRLLLLMMVLQLMSCCCWDHGQLAWRGWLPLPERACDRRLLLVLMVLQLVPGLRLLCSCWARLAWQRGWLPLPGCRGRACDGIERLLLQLLLTVLQLMPGCGCILCCNWALLAWHWRSWLPWPGWLAHDWVGRLLLLLPAVLVLWVLLQQLLQSSYCLFRRAHCCWFPSGWLLLLLLGLPHLLAWPTGEVRLLHMLLHMLLRLLLRLLLHMLLR